jgi:hypothetical protein
MTYTGVLATILTGMEPSIALSLACIPFLRPLVKRGLLGSSSPDSRYSSHALGSKVPTNGRPFKEISDDSSEVQLQPMGSDNGFACDTEVGKDEGPKGHKQPAERTGAILVSKGWTVA